MNDDALSVLLKNLAATSASAKNWFWETSTKNREKIMRLEESSETKERGRCMCISVTRKKLYISEKLAEKSKTGSMTKSHHIKRKNGGRIGKR